MLFASIIESGLENIAELLFHCIEGIKFTSFKNIFNFIFFNIQNYEIIIL